MATELIEIDQELMDTIASYMNENVRENLHGDIKTDTPNSFLKAYIKRDPSFIYLLKQEFNYIFKSNNGEENGY